jgi:hypothetical protein
LPAACARAHHGGQVALEVGQRHGAQGVGPAVADDQHAGLRGGHMIGKAAKGHHGHARQRVGHGGAGQAQVHAQGRGAQQFLRAAHGRHGQARQGAGRAFDAAKGQAVAIELDHARGGRCGWLSR